MEKVQIVYALIASENTLFFQELWASAFSFRLHEPDRAIRVLCDKPTYEYITKFSKFVELVNEIIIVDVPEDFSPRLRSRQIKTTVRRYVKGSYLFVDTDTICAESLGNIDDYCCDIALENEFHVPLPESVFKHLVAGYIKNAFETELTEEDRWFNSGVIFVNDTSAAYRFYENWHKNWKHSALERGNPQDQPALLITHREMGNVISALPGEYNCQVGLCVKYLASAKIFHFLHYKYPHDQSFNPFQSKDIYRKIKAEGGISYEVEQMIKNVKMIYPSPSCVVGWPTMNFLMCPAVPILEKIYNEGGPASWLMLKLSGWLEKLHKLTRNKKA